MKPTIIIAVLINCIMAAQVPDTSKDKPVQYRRGIELQEGYQTYEEKYSGKDLEEIKRSLFPLRSTGVWTELNPKVPRVNYFGINFVNKDTGWACGGSGAIIKTTNGGEDWSIAETPVTNLLLKIHSYNGQIVIATGYDGIILRSTDGGENFVQVTSGVGTGIDLWGVQMVNDTLGWVCGLNQTLLKTTDGGLTWQSITAGLNQHYWSLDFLNEQYGMIACGGGKILKTTDGGTNWLQLQAGDDRTLYTIDIIDSAPGGLHIASGGGAYGKNVYSSDGGVTWTQNTNIIFENGVNCIAFINADTGYAIGENWAINKTENRGVTWWASAPVYADWWINLLPNGIGYSAGDALKIYKTSGGYDNWKKIFLTDNFNDVSFINEDEGFIVVRDPAKLYKTTNGGINWDSVPGAPGGTNIIFTDEQTGLISSSQGRIYKTTDKGNVWYQTVTPVSTSNIGKIYFINETTGWAVGGNNIYKTTDGGENWVIQFTHTHLSFTSIHFVDHLWGWASILSNRPYKTTDGGNNWVQQTNLDIWESRDVIFENYTNGFLLESNKLYKTSDGGIVFNLVPGITGFSVAAQFTTYDYSTIFITGYRTFRSIDGGYTWLDFNELTGIRINGLSLLGIGNGYAIGEMGILLRYYDETVPVELINFSGLIKGDVVFLNWLTATESNNKGFSIERKKEEEVNWSELAFIDGVGTSTAISHYEYKDVLSQSGNYNYRLKQIDYNGQYEFSKEIDIEFMSNLDFYLAQNFPNPFNPITNINFNIPEKTLVRIILYDITGKEIKKVITEEMEAGFHSVQLNSEGLSSGVYFYKMITGSGFTAVNKLTIIK